MTFQIERACQEPSKMNEKNNPHQSTSSRNFPNNWESKRDLEDMHRKETKKKTNTNSNTWNQTSVANGCMIREDYLQTLEVI